MIPFDALALQWNSSVSISFRRGVGKVAADTMVVQLLRALGTSAWYAPGASVAYLVDSILNDQKKMIACSVLLKESMSKMIFVLVFLV
jgi:malate dehydrogenase